MRPTHVNGRYSTTFRLPSSGGSRTDSLDTLTRPVTLAAFVTDICFKRWAPGVHGYLAVQSLQPIDNDQSNMLCVPERSGEDV